MPRKPVKCDDGFGVHDLTCIQRPDRIAHAGNDDTNVFAFVLETVEPRRCTRIYSPDEQVERLGGGAGTREATTDMDEFSQVTPRLFARLPDRHFGRPLPCFNHTGYAFEQPRVPTADVRAWAKLLNENDLIGDWVDRQNCRNRSALKDLTNDRGTQTSFVERMTQI